MYPARNPDEITASFDWVIYDKAASIMKMMEEALGKENYDQAINKLLIRVLAKNKMHEKEKNNTNKKFQSVHSLCNIGFVLFNN